MLSPFQLPVTTKISIFRELETLEIVMARTTWKTYVISSQCEISVWLFSFFPGITLFRSTSMSQRHFGKIKKEGERKGSWIENVTLLTNVQI